jgi:hypothetical protein
MQLRWHAIVVTIIELSVAMACNCCDFHRVVKLYTSLHIPYNPWDRLDGYPSHELAGTLRTQEEKQAS